MSLVFDGKWPQKYLKRIFFSIMSAEDQAHYFISTETYDFKMKPFWSECFYYIYGMHVSLCPRSCFEFESKAFVNCQGSQNRF